ncbi:PREDICTED: uncharacterized protein LOC109220077 [Nicotiana attenuata]|uniref:uncharacterized protein LOC109220077 n=1 Tax=Nicotiana attenuata TaxID=49451 RepID=UPI0009052566|nr:PREDICTED: uncharacterized protein LOC109220077 [Nicotiana attenuata]
MATNNFEIKQGLLQTIQNNCVFRGKLNEDPNTHLMNFDEIINTFQHNGVSKDTIYLRKFPFLLREDAKHWLRSLPTGSIQSWEDMTKKFLEKYLSAAKIGKFCKEIHNFKQEDTETEDDKQCSWRPSYEENSWEDCCNSNKLSEDTNQWHADDNERRKKIGIHQVDSNTSMQVQPDTMAIEI